MKLIIITVLSLFLASSCFAQKIELGLNGGEVFNSAPVSGFYKSYSNNKPSDLSATGNLSISYNYKKWQAGLSAGYMQLSYTAGNNDWMNFVDYFNTPSERFTPGSKPVIGNLAIPVKLFINRKICFKKLDIYGGLSGGYAFMSYKYQGEPFPGNPYKTVTGCGADFGIQLGVNYNFSKHLVANLQLNGDYINYTYKEPGFSGTLLAFPMTIGIHYRF